MTEPAFIGDQLILEEDYDENYKPSEQEIQEYAREIGIDPDNEPELMWLAREGVVAPLPPEWKPCQDVTGDIYYFNFSTGRSTWDHPCEEHYRRLVVQERERSQLTATAGAGGAKKDKKKKKEKKEKKGKKKKEVLKAPTSLTSPLVPLAGLGRLRGLDVPGHAPLSGSVPSLRGSLGSSGSLEPLKTLLPAPRSSGATTVLGTRQDERVSLTLPGLDDGDDGDVDDKISDNEQSLCGSDGFPKNLHLDLDALGGGLQYEVSEASEAVPAEERTEPELQDLALSRDHSPEPPSQQEFEANKNTAEPSPSIDVKASQKVQEISDLSGSISLLEKDDKEETQEDEEGNEERGRKAESQNLSKDEDNPPYHKVDRLVLHQSSQSPSLSNSFSLEQVDSHQAVVPSPSLGASAGVQRPETSRGRPVRTLDEDAEPTLKKQASALEEEPSWTVQKEEEEKERLLKEKEARRHFFYEQLKREEQEEEQKLKEESEERLRVLQQHLLSKRREEEARLNEVSDRRLVELRESVRKEREKQEEKLRLESDVMLKELQVALEEERAAARDRLEAQKKQDVERLKAELEEELQAERRRLQREQDEKLNSLKQEVVSTERRRELLMSPRPEQQLAEYHRELSDVLQQVRDEVQREHENKLEQLRDDHRREMNSIREKYLDEETALRERSLRTLQDDREQLQASHAVQLERLRLQLDSQTQKTQLGYSRKESELKDLADLLELREKELRSQEAMLQTKAAELTKRRRMLGDEEKDLDRQIETLPRLVKERDQLKEELLRAREEVAQARELAHRAREERNEAKGAEERMREERDKTREESRRSKVDKERLESKVALLQESELEQSKGGKTSPKAEQGRKKADKAVRLSSEWRDSSLHVEDLDEPSLSPGPDSHSSMDGFRQYVSSHGHSIQKTKRFLERESHRLMERQAALQAAQTSSSQDPGLGGLTEEKLRTLQQESRDVAELQRTVQRGNSLLRKKEEQLQQLESSMAEELAFDDSSGLAGDRKVTFDVTESDVSSTVEPPHGTGGHPSVPAKVQELAESLQQISGQLNAVLSALGSLAPRENGTPYAPFSTSLPQPSLAPTCAPVLPQARGWLSGSSVPPLTAGLSEPLWSFVPQSSSAASPLFSRPGASEVLINSRWSQIFPGSAVDPVTSSTTRTPSVHPSYTPVSLREMQRSVEVDGRRLQGLIDGNKRWLDLRKKDTSIPLFTRYQAPPTKSSLLQLGLDDSNQIRVYRY
ncbi:centrosomal protein of 164 kDa isoform X2 [Austrofundulus limnaeus]|uniref:Centrosomal protein of 164 kDa n=1 Tax=Austrofundulus limnaeus TaxID=52670 RepID=A0A2I4CNA8_AUSLI|nr:PREDICTED: centrosomal protein of 164 kDa isoform X2 [Austrofundulus limnaeus]